MRRFQQNENKEVLLGYLIYRSLLIIFECKKERQTFPGKTNISKRNKRGIELLADLRRDDIRLSGELRSNFILRMSWEDFEILGT